MIPSNITQESVLLLHMDREAWRAVIHGVAKSRTWLSNGTELMWSLDRLNFGWYLEICSSIYFSSGNFPSLLYSRTVVSNSLWHHAACQAYLVLHHLPEFAQIYVHWVGDAIQPSHPVIPFSSCLQSFPAPGSFQMSQFFASDGQSVRVSALASVLTMNIQGWSPLGWTGWISLQSKGLSRVFPNTTVQKHQFFCTQLFL